VFRLMGDRWNILILREIVFGTNRFGELQRALTIAPNMLTNRLASLVDEGAVSRHQYCPTNPGTNTNSPTRAISSYPRGW
jgi:DNA-binding HxlR family transcriptional regulator